MLMFKLKGSAKEREREIEFVVTLKRFSKQNDKLFVKLLRLAKSLFKVTTNSISLSFSLFRLLSKHFFEM